MDMDDRNLAETLEAYRSGALSLEDAMDRLKILPYEDLDFAKIDHHRATRQGFPEVVFCQGKTVEQVVIIMQRLAQHNRNILGSRATAQMYEAVREVLPDARYHELARMIVVQREDLQYDEQRFILVMTAGTSDIPVAEEAAITAEVMGNKVERVYDVGVAGIHRLLAQQDMIRRANVIIVVAGMEGALASVVGGIAAKPVIAVPTSVGYGANFGGLAALLSMLNSCAAGIAVVNIDNGFGAGRLANIINKMR
jgi:NCAIR mutase (PurE)-related protein